MKEKIICLSDFLDLVTPNTDVEIFMWGDVAAKTQAEPILKLKYQDVSQLSAYYNYTVTSVSCSCKPVVTERNQIQYVSRLSVIIDRE